jgi:beta-lactamase regulating signal transducer with metallopeptidase domain
MSLPSHWAGSLASLADGSIGPVLVAKWTLVLALAWMAHAALARRNPRWRVVLWRGAVLGVGLVGALAAVPPILRVSIAPDPQTILAERHERIAEPARAVPAPEAVGAVANGFPRTVQPENSVPLARTGPSPVPGAVSAPVDSPPSLPLDLAPSWAPRIWLAGAILLTVRLILAGLALDRLVRRSSAASEDLVNESRAIARRLGCTGVVRVVRSEDVATPCVAGMVRPVLLIPSRPSLQPDDLRAVLAHELAHARHHDLAWNLAAHLASIVLWFHPLAWRIRAAHAAACDAVSDAVAADFLGDVASYGRTLARLALGAADPAPIHVLAMARTSDVVRRLEALNRWVFRNPLGWSRVAPAILVGGVLLVLIAGFGFTHAKQAAKPAAQQTPGKLTLRAVADATGQPIEGAAVEWQLRINNGRFQTTKNSTDRDGRTVLEWPGGATVNGLIMTARKPGFGPYSIDWDDALHPLHLPAVKEIRCVAGVPIGGVVKDEAGAPVAGARITVLAPPAETERSFHHFNLVVTTTDAQGRWRFDDAPTDLSGMSFYIDAPRLLQGSSAALRKTDTVTVLKRGFTVRGRVLDAQGQPVAGATVRGGETFYSNSQVKTDARGEFLLENCAPGASVVTVRAEHFAPDLRQVHPEDRPTLEFRLGPAHTLRGKVVDRAGRPVAGITFSTDAWRGHRSLGVRFDTDKDGRFEWRDAPGDKVLYNTTKQGYMSLREVAMTADGAEAVLTVAPVLAISGRVTDAETGQPLATFRVVQGVVFANNPRIAWLERNAAEFRGGRYTVRHSEPYDGYAVRIEAPGYKPAESRVFRPGEVAPTFDFAMARAAAADLLTGFVYRPDGRPAAGADVALATPEHPLVFEMERFQFGRENGMSFAKTDLAGRFTFDRPGGAYLLAAMSDDGYAEARPEQMAESGRLTLKPWGKIKGRARIGRQPAANQFITFQRRDERQAGPGGVNASYSIETRTDLQGNFDFDRVIPGAGEVARVVVTEFANGRMSQHIGCWQEPVDIEPGQTVLVQIGARGRPVVGRVVLQPAPGVRPVEWRQNRPATIEKARDINPLQGLLGRDPHQFDRFAAGLDKDGRFRIDDVPPGHYELTVTIDAPLKLNGPGLVQALGSVKVPVDVPKGDDDVPIDLGEIKADVKGR